MNDSNHMDGVHILYKLYFCILTPKKVGVWNITGTTTKDQSEAKPPPYLNSGTTFSPLCNLKQVT